MSFCGAKTSRPAFAGRLSTRCTKTAKNEDRTGLRVCRSFEDSTGSGFARPLSRPATPLMGLASLSEVVPANRSAGIGFALPLRRQPPKRPRPWGLPCSPEARGCRRRPRTASPRVGVPFRVLPGRLADALSGAAPPWSSCPFSACRCGSPLIRDLPRPGSGAAAGFLTLLPRCVSRVLPTV